MAQPTASVSGIGTGLPDSTASSASLRSCAVTCCRGLPSAAYRLSIRPRYLIAPVASTTTACGVIEACAAAAIVRAPSTAAEMPRSR